MTLRSVKVHEHAVRQELRGSRTVRQQLQPVAARATRMGRQVARERLQRRTGRYESSFRSSVEPGRGGDEIARIVLENDAPHAKYIEHGTRPHVMPKKATLYVWEGDHDQVIANYGPIKHPGTDPERVIEVALGRVARGGI